MFDIAIIGGGLAGLVSAVLLGRSGFKVLLIERKKYPFHRVCGEYISNEVMPFLKEHRLFPELHDVMNITRFKLSSTNGKTLEMDLGLGGFGISRYYFDHWLMQQALQSGVEVRENSTVREVVFDRGVFQVRIKSDELFESKYVIGAFGKRSNLDGILQRSFFQRRSPYYAVKYHVRTREVPGHHVELHNFDNGYCGISKVDKDTFNLCYLSHQKNLEAHRSIPKVEEKVLRANPHLRQVFDRSDFIFERPLVIHQVSFEPKEPVFRHILMVGDSAGMITPLCGNGMAMSIHSAKLLGDLLIHHFDDREYIERVYEKVWKSTFSVRHMVGRKIQALFGSSLSSQLAVRAGNLFPPIASFLMRQTHGKPF